MTPGPPKKPRRVKGKSTRYECHAESKSSGCYNCSQRRINCDRGTPCRKCLKKGLECHGLGVRYRFNDGVASRGKLAGSSVPVPNSKSLPSTIEADHTGSDKQLPLDPKVNDDALVQMFDDIISSKLMSTNTGTAYASTESSPHLLITNQHMPRSLEALDCESQFLLSYFSDNVAPAMVAINFVFNGYRDMVLPISEQETTLRNAIMAASASHMTWKNSSWKSRATKYHMKAIQGLKKRDKTQFPKENERDRDISLCTMVILLIEDMIIVGPDFHLLLEMVKTFIQSEGGENNIEKNPLGKFLMQQVRKMSLYASPFKSDITALESLQMSSCQDLDFLYSCLDFHPEYSDIIFKIADIIQRASRIHLARAGRVSENTIAEMVRYFFHKTTTFNAASPGGHILIWPFFIVGLECTSPRDMRFVESQLNLLWEHTGFGNTLYAIELLKRIWEGEFGEIEVTRVFDKVEGFVM